MSTKLLRQGLRDLFVYLAAAHIDLRLWLTGKTDRQVPPLRLQFVGTGDFRRVGEQLADVLIGVGGLRSSDRVLDIGCGVGRVAIPLTGYLDATASYHGFDVVKRGIRWCQRHITPRYPNFRFHHVRVINPAYRWTGERASQFRFPFDDRSFDFAFAISVFTHLVAVEIRQYLAESARVLAPGGRLLATFFLLNEFSLGNLPTRDVFTFPYASGVMRFLNAGVPAVGVAVQEDALLEMVREAGLIVEQIAYGTWSGRADGTDFQDVLVCRRS